MLQRPTQKSSHGFSIIEIMLALSIFAIIGIATVKHIQQISTTKDIAFKELDLHNAIRAALSVMRYDLSQAFHIRYDDLGEETKKLILSNQPVPHTLFDGRKNELIFTSLSHRVYYAGVRECEQTEISYFLQKQKGPASALMKRESEFIDGDLYQGGSVQKLLDGVSSLLFRYWNEKTEKWQDDWNSDGGENQDRFPHAVKLTLVVTETDGKNITVEAAFKIGFVNNTEVLVQLT
jgi:general secretion pathway protein J